MTKEEIIAALNVGSSAVVDWFELHGATQFSFAPEGKWNTGQHLSHLILSVKPLNRAMGLPKPALRISFGRPNRPLRSLDMMEDKYSKGLTSGFKATGSFIPALIESEKMGEMLEQYQTLHKKLGGLVNKWSERSLDAYLLPHPALGKLMVREMLFFTIIHTKHHLTSLIQQYEQVQV